VDIGNVTWTALREPSVLAVVVFIIVLLLAKPLLEILYKARWERAHPGKAPPDEVPLLDLLVNAVALSLAWGLAWFRLNPQGRDAWGETVIVGIVAWALATGGYEGVKNLGKSVGVNVAELVRKLWGVAPTARSGTGAAAEGVTNTIASDGPKS
jgi:hypothetical protein